MAQVGDIVLVREDRHTDRGAHVAYVAAAAAHKAGASLAEVEQAAFEALGEIGWPADAARDAVARYGKEPPPPENPAPTVARYCPLIVEEVLDDGAIAGTLFVPRKGNGFKDRVEAGDADGCWVPKPAAA